MITEINERVNAFLNRPIEGEWPYLWIDATHLKEREGGRIVSTAVIVAVAANTGGRREVLGVASGPSEAETFWKSFLRSLADRGLRGVKLVISDDHKGRRSAAGKVFNATQQRCRVHWMRNALAHVGAKQRPAVVAMLKTIFAQESADAAHEQWRHVADTLRERYERLALMMDGSREEVLAYMAFPKEHWTQISSTNSLERVNKEIKRRADVIGIFPNTAAVRLVGALMLEQNDEWSVSRRYMTLETVGALSDNLLSACRHWQPDHPWPDRGSVFLHHPAGHYPSRNGRNPKLAVACYQKRVWVNDRRPRHKARCFVDHDCDRLLVYSA